MHTRKAPVIRYNPDPAFIASQWTGEAYSPPRPAAKPAKPVPVKFGKRHAAPSNC